MYSVEHKTGQYSPCTVICTGVEVPFAPAATQQVDLHYSVTVNRTTAFLGYYVADNDQDPKRHTKIKHVVGLG